MPVLLLLTVVLSSTVQAGPWVRDAGHAYLKGGYSRFTADTFVQPDGSTVTGTTYIGHTHHLYGEVGVARGVQVVFNAPFVGSRNIIDETAYINRWGGDAQLGVEGGRSLGQTPISLQLLGKLPLYDNAELATYGAAAQRFPAIGDGQVDLTATLAVGHGWSVGPVRGWVAGELGYRHRTEWWLGDSRQPTRTYGDGLPYSAQLGWSPVRRDRDLGWVFASLSGIHRLQEDTVTQQFMQASLGGALRISHGLAAELGYSQLFNTRAAAPGQSLSVGLSWSP
jgi:hypothetical protein